MKPNLSSRNAKKTLTDQSIVHGFFTFTGNKRFTNP